MCGFLIKKSYLLNLLLKKGFLSFFSGMFGASFTIGEALTLHVFVSHPWYLFLLGTHHILYRVDITLYYTYILIFKLWMYHLLSMVLNVAMIHRAIVSPGLSLSIFAIAPENLAFVAVFRGPFLNRSCLLSSIFFETSSGDLQPTPPLK